MIAAYSRRLSPCFRGEDEGEGLERVFPTSTLSYPLSFRKGEATRHMPDDAIISQHT
jgi:hypothetical protein